MTSIKDYCIKAVFHAVARLMPGHPIARNLKASSRDGTTPPLPHVRHNVGNTRTRPDRTDETLRLAQNPERIDGETWNE